MELSETQYRVLAALADAGGTLTATRLVELTGLDQSPVAAACTELAQRGLAEIEERAYRELSRGPEVEALGERPLPERRIVRVLREQGGRCRLTDIPTHSDLTQADVGQALRWLTQRGWATKSGDTLALADGAPPEDGPPTADEALLAALPGGAALSDAQLRDAGIDVDAALRLLAKRKGYLNIKDRRQRTVTLTAAGRELLARGMRAGKRVTQLTPEMLTDGSWRQVELAPYDVTVAARKLYPGKEHPFQRTIDRVRRVFLEMGFTEIASPWVESSFWDFDALFQPQDHPARDMQDTFYVARPARCRLPDDALVEQIKATHETGGDTGSTGWRYRWDRELAHRPVLRTHTTAATIRALAAHATRGVGGESEGRKAGTSEGQKVGKSEGQKVGKLESRKAGMGGQDAALSDLATFQPSDLPTLRPSDLSRDPPGKYFCVGPVFRRETVDFKHLPVFHQVDGIIVDPHASLRTLLGTLGAFYNKMGFPKVRFRPSFFPYTEPSVEVDLWLEQRGQWVEMGGSGIFRPEVTRPLGIHDRVLAWGLGLERLAMMIFNLKSIGELYFATMPWLRETPVVRE